MARMWLFWACIGSAMCCTDTEKKSTPILAILGSNVLLPCTSKSKPTRIQSFNLYWQIPGPFDLDWVVDYADETEKDGRSMQETRFRNRTKFFRSHFKDGNFSLLLSDVQREDEACYKCLIRFGIERTTSSQEGFINLHTSAHYNEPVLHIKEEPSSKSRNITCSATGGYPEPDVHWTIDGKPVPKGSRMVQTEITKKASKGTYSVYSSLVTEANKDVECIIENKRLKENRSASVTGTRIGGSGLSSTSGLALCDGYAAFIYLSVQWIFWHF
ncbi:CD276 antigen-like [Pleurodeles waltl]|uniref:CD276 antigen-like n=1 Tax=Pleurodeles waltl TaxID=8319 RepID=UPI003709B29E